jgi:hypothetical protein
VYLENRGKDPLWVQAPCSWARRLIQGGISEEMKVEEGNGELKFLRIHECTILSLTRHQMCGLQIGGTLSETGALRDSEMAGRGGKKGWNY